MDTKAFYLSRHVHVDHFKGSKSPKLDLRSAEDPGSIYTSAPVVWYSYQANTWGLRDVDAVAGLAMVFDLFF